MPKIGVQMMMLKTRGCLRRLRRTARHWTEIIDQAVASGAQYLLIEQDDQYGRDSFDCLQTSRDNLVALGYENLF